jgi:BTB/POZ domain
MRELLSDEEHMDAIFLVHSENTESISSNVMLHSKENNGVISGTIGGDKSGEIMDATMTIMDTISSSTVVENPTNMIQIRAHKSVLTARSDYFKGLFRTNASMGTSGGNSKIVSATVEGVGSEITSSVPSTATMAFKESVESTINVEPIFRELHIRALLEFIYTNRIADIRKMQTDDLLAILHLSDQWLLRDLKRLSEHELMRSHLSVSTVARLYCATEDLHAKRLSRACIEFIMANLRQVTGNASFLEEMQNYPHLMLPVLKGAADLIPEGPLHKKQRTATGIVPIHDPHVAAAAAASHGGGTPASAAAVAAAAAAAASFRSSPVPDLDT